MLQPSSIILSTTRRREKQKQQQNKKERGARLWFSVLRVSEKDLGLFCGRAETGKNNLESAERSFFPSARRS